MADPGILKKTNLEGPHFKLTGNYYWIQFLDDQGKSNAHSLSKMILAKKHTWLQISPEELLFNKKNGILKTIRYLSLPTI